MVPEQLFSKVAENVLGTECLSECGVLSTFSENLHPCFLVRAEHLAFIIIDSMFIRQEVTNKGFWESCL